MAIANKNAVYLEGPTSPIAPGSKFLVDVRLDAKDTLNAFDLEIAYPKEKLKFLDFDNTDSLVSIWYPKPSILPSGNLGISGGILKGYSGSDGLLIKLSFEALDDDAQISLVKNNLYVADGKGTEIKGQLATSILSVNENAKVVAEEAIPFQSTPADRIIEEGIKEYKAEVESQNIFIPIIIVVILVFCVIKVYNKWKRKPNL